MSVNIGPHKVFERFFKALSYLSSNFSELVIQAPKVMKREEKTIITDENENVSDVTADILDDRDMMTTDKV